MSTSLCDRSHLIHSPLRRAGEDGRKLGHLFLVATALQKGSYVSLSFPKIRYNNPVC